MIGTAPPEAPTLATVCATDMRPGDVMVADGCIDITVVGIYPERNPARPLTRPTISGFIIVTYSCFGGSCSDERTMVAESVVTVMRAAEEGAH